MAKIKSAIGIILGIDRLGGKRPRRRFVPFPILGSTGRPYCTRALIARLQVTAP
jgi:hypothetical protein